MEVQYTYTPDEVRDLLGAVDALHASLSELRNIDQVFHLARKNPDIAGAADIVQAIRQRRPELLEILQDAYRTVSALPRELRTGLPNLNLAEIAMQYDLSEPTEYYDTQ